MTDAPTTPGLVCLRPEWDEYFMLLAKLAAIRSTCLSRPAGAVIVLDRQVLATGYNGSMPGVAHCTDKGVCFRRSAGAGENDKYDICRAIHAEANAIAQAARRGVSIEGATVYTTLAPCFVCTKLMASARIRRVVYEHEYESPDRERDEIWRRALDDAGIECAQLTLTPDTVRRAGELISGVTSLRRPLSATGEPLKPPTDFTDDTD
ncbi:MAG TPA: dCMP deaminase family protein [Armatimonadota bacterium]|nr:dCMP deaminase family protein [Armatimonadota bacterium]